MGKKLTEEIGNFHCLLGRYLLGHDVEAPALSPEAMDHLAVGTGATAWSTRDIQYLDPYSVNIMGRRWPTSTECTGFDDSIWVAWVDGKGVKRAWYCTHATTRPGSPRKERIATLKPGFYRGVYKLGRHKGRYEALVPTEALPVLRGERTESKAWGLNFHRASLDVAMPDDVGPWSEGCQVFRYPEDFFTFLAIVKGSMAIYGPRVSYNLVTA